MIWYTVQIVADISLVWNQCDTTHIHIKWKVYICLSLAPPAIMIKPMTKYQTYNKVIWIDDTNVKIEKSSMYRQYKNYASWRKIFWVQINCNCYIWS
jgi:hypothetical protein